MESDIISLILSFDVKAEAILVLQTKELKIWLQITAKA